uniref:KRAB domain-containing protein n=1 Tax=Capra hircus TaxID=9925 RepID=A0A8C2RCB0_CAPHI
VTLRKLTFQDMAIDFTLEEWECLDQVSGNCTGKRISFQNPLSTLRVLPDLGIFLEQRKHLWNVRRMETTATYPGRCE